MVDTGSNPFSGRAKARVLVVDDSKLVRVTARKILDDRFDLVFAEDGEQAWEQIRTDETIQVVFTDLGMPKLDGYGLIQRVRTSEDEGIRNLPLIVITGAAEEEGVRRKVFEIGATDFVTKPFKSTTITARADAHASYRRDALNLKKNTNIDVLTGTLNVTGLQQRLEKDISFVNRHRENMAVMILELDDFQGVYDRIGKKASEHVIKEVAKALCAAVRTEDSVGRDSLATYTVSLPMAKSEGVVKLARRLCEKIGAVTLKMGTELISISACVGISTVSKGGVTTADEMVQCAEQALGNAKSVGCGEVQLLKFESSEGNEPSETISIDSMLDYLEQGQNDRVTDQMGAILKRLTPLLALLPEEVSR
jgi:diguanylate cyclase (GGDEF)-like protein